jgi:hypothetical protein
MSECKDGVCSVDLSKGQLSDPEQVEARRLRLARAREKFKRDR